MPPFSTWLQIVCLVTSAGIGFRLASAEEITHSEQSPVNIGTADVVWQPTWPMIDFYYATNADLTVENINAPSVEGSVRAIVNTSSMLNFAADTYNLLQFHFHQSAEHAIDGHRAAMELHFVNQKQGSTGNDDLLIVSLLIEIGAVDNPLLAPIFSSLGSIPNPSDSFTLSSFNIATLLPDDQRVFRYTGSLTTPPYSEHENWNIVAGAPLLISQGQFDAFTALFPQGNARDLQPLDGRVVALVPEPSSFGLIGGVWGVLLMAVWRRRCRPDMVVSGGVPQATLVPVGITRS